MNLLKRWIEYWDRKVKKLTLFDLKLAQACAMFFALILAKLIPQIMELSIWWFVALAALCCLRLWYVVFIKPDVEPADAGGSA